MSRISSCYCRTPLLVLWIICGNLQQRPSSQNPFVKELRMCKEKGETWWSTPETSNFVTHSTKSIGGGLCPCADKKWCNRVVIKETLCAPDIVLLSVSLRPFYLPRELPQLLYHTAFHAPKGCCWYSYLCHWESWAVAPGDHTKIYYGGLQTVQTSKVTGKLFPVPNMPNMPNYSKQSGCEINWFSCEQQNVVALSAVLFFDMLH